MPNPNLYYLSCPFLRRQLAVLEAGGAIRRFQELLQSDDALGAAVREAQESHLREWRQAGGRQSQVKSAVIAGALQPLVLKCLHAHYAWYLVHPDYRLGRLIAAEIGEDWCSDDRCGSAIGESGEEVGS